MGRGPLGGAVTSEREPTDIALDDDRADPDGGPKLFRALVENGSDGLALIGSDGRVRYVSGSMIRMLGTTRQGVVGSVAVGWVDPVDQERVAGLFVQLLQRPRSVVSTELRPPRNATAISSSRPPSRCGSTTPGRSGSCL